MKQEQFEELAILYAANALGESERSDFENYLRKAKPHELEFLSETLQMSLRLSTSVEYVTPRGAVKKSLFEQIKLDMESTSSQTSAGEVKQDLSKTPSAEPRRTAHEPTPGLLQTIYQTLRFDQPIFALGGLAVFVLISGLLVLQVSKQSQLYDSKVKEFNKLAEQAQKERGMIALLEKEGIIVANLKSQTGNRKMNAKLYLDRDGKKAVFEVSHINKAPEGKTYQLWVIQKGKPISLGIYDIAQDTNKKIYMIDQLDMETMDNLDAVAVTVEPAGGVPQPTGTKILIGTFKI